MNHRYRRLIHVILEKLAINRQIFVGNISPIFAKCKQLNNEAILTIHYQANIGQKETVMTNLGMNDAMVSTIFLV